MDEQKANEASSPLVQSFRAPRAAGVAGVVFALFTLFEMTISRMGGAPTEGAGWLANSDQFQLGVIAIALVPFTGIAFLWFIGVIRTRLGDREDRLFSTIFLGSGLLYVMTTFVSAATLGGVARMYPQGTSQPDSTVTLATALSAELIASFGLRMAGVFVISVTTLVSRTKVAPLWLVIVGYVTTLLLLFGSTLNDWLALVFPLWVLIVSVHILIVGFDRPDS